MSVCPCVGLSICGSHDLSSMSVSPCVDLSVRHFVDLMTCLPLSLSVSYLWTIAVNCAFSRSLRLKRLAKG